MPTLSSPFKLTFFPAAAAAPPSPTVDQCASHVGVTTAPNAFHELMSALRAHAAVASTLDDLAPAQRASQLHRAADLVRGALDAYVRASEDALRERMVLPFVARSDSEASWWSTPEASVLLGGAEMKTEAEAGVDEQMRETDRLLATPKRKETTLEDLDPWLVQNLDDADRSAGPSGRQQPQVAKQAA